MASKLYEIAFQLGAKLSSSFGSTFATAQRQMGSLNEQQIKAAAASGKSSSAFQSLKSALIGAAAGIGVATSFKAIMDAASKSEQTTAQLQNVLKSTGGAAGVTQQAAENLASSLSSVTTFSKGTIVGSESLLLTFTKIGKDVMPQATETVLNMSQALGQDTKSSAIQLGKALNDPLTGMTALQRVGVTFSAQQKQQIETMQKAGNIMGAQKIILSELNTEFGGSARAAGATFSGQIQIIKNNMAGVGASIGLALMPTIQMLLPSITAGMLKLSTFIKSNLGPAIQNIASVISSKVIPVIKTGFTDAGNIAKWFGDHLNLVVPIVNGIVVALVSYKVAQLAVNTATKAGMIIQTLSKAWAAASVFIGLLREGESLAAVAQLALNTAMEANPVGVVTVAIMALVGVAALIIKNWGPIKRFFGNLWVGVKAVFSNFWSWIKAFFSTWGTTILAVMVPFIGIPVLIVQHWGQIKAKLTAVWTALKSAIGNAMMAIANSVAKIWNSIVKAITSNPLFIIISAIFKGILAVVIIVTYNLFQVISKVWKSIQTAVSSALNKIKQIVIPIWNSIYSAISSVLTSIWNFIVRVWNVIYTAVSAAVTKVWQVIVTIWNAVYSSVAAVLTTIWTFIVSIWNNVYASVSAVVTTIWTFIVSGFNHAASGVTSIFQGIYNTIVSIFQNIWNVVKSIINTGIGMVNGFIGGVNKIIGVANKVPGVSISAVPTIPKLAQGGYIRHRTGGILANIGEGNEDEIVSPVSKLKSILGGAQGALSQVMQVTYQITIEGNAGEDDVYAGVERGNDDLEKRLGQINARRQRLSLQQG